MPLNNSTSKPGSPPFNREDTMTALYQMKPTICRPTAVSYRQKGIFVTIYFLHAGGKNKIALCEFLRKDWV